MPEGLHHPPGPIGLPLIGVLFDFLEQPAQYLQSLVREYGDVVYFRIGMQRVYLLNRPDLIQEVLVTNQANYKKSRMLERARVLLGDGLLTLEPPEHTTQRRMVQPVFSQERLASYSAVMVECADRVRSRWRDGATIDVDKEMMELTLVIVARVLFGIDVDGEKARGIGQALTDVIGTFNLMLWPGSGLWRRLPLPVMRRAERARKYLDKVIYEMIRERRAAGGSGDDLLSMLISASEDGGRLSDRQVRDHALTFLLAGHETTATALTWTWYLISQNPDVEARMRAEVDAVLGGRLPRHEDLDRLEYTDRVFAEALRLYPPAWAIGRKVKTTARVFNHVLPKGSVIVLCPYVTHRHARLWPEPERFDPDRFLPEAIASRPRFAYFPFGGGTRVCIGERFAWNEGVLLLATIAQRRRLALAPGQKVGIRPQMTLRPRFGMKMVCSEM
jgi:cytochrome P450